VAASVRESYVRTHSDIFCNYREYETFMIIDPAVACPREGKTDICDVKSRDRVGRIGKIYCSLQEGRTALYNAVTKQPGNYYHTLHLWGLHITSVVSSRFYSSDILSGREEVVGCTYFECVS
jgi:hypothetical protein